tara:strand:- start:330 stop:1592 length:1263 start_codon:yes stop_codon:yes gene_type:complete
MSNYKTIKGTHDLLPKERTIWRFVENIIHTMMRKSGYGEIKTPAFENTELFIRGVGTETDIVSKEMYSWIDQGNNNLTLKPELTAPVVRAYLQHNMYNDSPIQRLYYFDTLFRRERPQKGRQRQFHQFGAEAIGSPNPEQDAEIIILAYNIYKKFNIKDMSIRLNSIGNLNIRPQYLNKLRSSIKKNLKEFCNTCQLRYKKNTLRLFDCKNQECQNLLNQNAPLIFDSISKDDKIHFEKIISILNTLNIPYIHDHKLVRGLDYYSNTTFEINSSILGAQDALCGGGRYNGLIEQLGGKPTPAVGFASGVERLILALKKQDLNSNNTDIYFAHVGDQVTSTAVKLANELRNECNKIVVLETLKRSIKAQMRAANRCNAKITLILGEEEFNQNNISVKNMDTGNQTIISLTKLIDYINLQTL